MAKKTKADELRELAARLTAIADELDAPVKEPESEKEISFTDIRAILAVKAREGKQEIIREILKSHGAEKLSDIDPKDYQTLAKEVEVL